MLAKSLAGHDKNRIYVIVGVEGDMVFVADGEIRTAERPKHKKMKHVQLIRKWRLQETADDIEIRRILKEYRKSGLKEDQTECQKQM